MEVILINDGSTDNSLDVIRDLAKRFSAVTIISHGQKKGQSYALSSGFSKAKGDTVVILDADLQVFPEDIPLLLSKIDEGYDLVNGIRINRRGALFHTLASGVSLFPFRVTYEPSVWAGEGCRAGEGNSISRLK